MLRLGRQQYLTSVPGGTAGTQADTTAAPQTALPRLQRSATTSRESLTHSVTGSQKPR